MASKIKLEHTVVPWNSLCFAPKYVSTLQSTKSKYSMVLRDEYGIRQTLVQIQI